MNVMSDDFTIEQPQKPKKVGNNGGGRKKIKIDLDQVEAHAARGLNLEDIAYCMGFSPRTLHANIKEDAEVAAAIARGRATGQKVIASALFKAAQAGHIEAAKFYLARRCNWVEKTETEISGKDGKPVALQMVISKDDAEL